MTTPQVPRVRIRVARKDGTPQLPKAGNGTPTARRAILTLKANTVIRSR